MEGIQLLAMIHWALVTPLVTWELYCAWSGNKIDIQEVHDALTKNVDAVTNTMRK